LNEKEGSILNLETDVPRIILGTMNFGGQVDEHAADQMLAMFLDRGYKEIDTAYKYNDGASEEVLGRLLTPERRGKVYLATKASPLDGGGLGPESIAKQVNTSLHRLRTQRPTLKPHWKHVKSFSRKVSSENWG
jgi:aryl-alcohol dehydrogenase-like predicted oxidoreductase